MKWNEIQTVEEYLSYFEEVIGREQLISCPDIDAHYQQIKKQFREVADQQDRGVLVQMRTLLGLDARLQILLQLFPLLVSEEISGVTEQDILDFMIVDSLCFYREATGKKMNDAIPCGLLYLSEKEKIRVP